MRLAIGMKSVADPVLCARGAPLIIVPPTGGAAARAAIEPARPSRARRKEKNGGETNRNPRQT
jgi:hypothetical protein